MKSISIKIDFYLFHLCEFEFKNEKERGGVKAAAILHSTKWQPYAAHN